MTTVEKKKIERSIKQYRVDLEELESIVKKWREQLRLKEFNKNCKDCYEAFVELQLGLASSGVDPKHRDDYQKKCYKITYSLLAKIEQDWDPDIFIGYYNSKTLPAFKTLWDAFHKYCLDIESKFSWARHSE